MTRGCQRIPVLCAVMLLGLGAGSPSAFAQNWMSDARRIAMGGVGGGDNLASKMVDSPQGAHSTIVIPLGLFQILRDIDIYNPDSDEFDPIRATEYLVDRSAVGRETPSSAPC